MGVYMCISGKHIAFISVSPMQSFKCNCEREMMEDAIKQVMKHAVAGHTDHHHVYCNSADHAMHILAESGFKLSRLFGFQGEQTWENEGGRFDGPNSRSESFA